LKAGGEQADHVVAFARLAGQQATGKQAALTVVPVW